jgi:hypothetical protein
MEKNYRIISLGGSSSNETNGFVPDYRDRVVNQSIPSVILAGYVKLLLQFRTDIKLYHWQTKSFSYHKIFDELLGSIDDLSDKFVETICGCYDIRPVMSGQTITIKNITQVNEIIDEIRLVALELKTPSIVVSNNSEIANIRDELLESIDKTLYLLSFK